MSIMNAGPQRARSNMSADRHYEIIDILTRNPPDLEARVHAHILAVLEDFELDVTSVTR